MKFLYGDVSSTLRKNGFGMKAHAGCTEFTHRTGEALTVWRGEVGEPVEVDLDRLGAILHISPGHARELIHDYIQLPIEAKAAKLKRKLEAVRNAYKLTALPFYRQKIEREVEEGGLMESQAYGVAKHIDELKDRIEAFEAKATTLLKDPELDP